MRRQWIRFGLLGLAAIVLGMLVVRRHSAPSASTESVPNVSSPRGRESVRTPPSSRRGPTRAVQAVVATPGEPVPAADPNMDWPAPIPDAIPGDYTFRFYDAAHAAEFVRLASRHGVDVTGQLERLNAVRVRTADPSALRDLLAAAPTPVAGSRTIHVRRPRDLDQPQPDAPTPPPGVTYVPFGASAPEWLGMGNDSRAWGEGITVAILDTAITAHPALTGARIERLDFGGGFPDDVTAARHGTAVASLIVGQGNPLQGAARHARILDVPVMDADGRGDSFTVAQGVVAAVDAGAQVINLCLGSYGDAEVLRAAVAYARQRGAAVVAAVGNDGLPDTMMYPAAYDGVVAVSATDMSGKVMYFSNRSEGVSLAAPGYGVHAAGGDGELVAFSGTSAAAPFASAAIAVLMAAEPGLSGREAADLLLAYADDFGAPGADAAYGKGILNLPRALERNTPGIRDMAVVPPYIDVDSDQPDEAGLTFLAQNRGTERLAAVTMRLVVDGAEQELKYYDVGVGETIIHRVRLTGGGIGERLIEVLQEVSMDGVDDTRPGNNRLRANLGRLSR